MSAIRASTTSVRLCGGILLVIATEMPQEPLQMRLGNLDGSTAGSVRVSS